MDQEHTDFYANNANIVASIYDLTLQFTAQKPMQSPVPDQPTPTEVIGVCNVSMSPQHAKAIAVLLVDNIIKYEKQTKTKLALPENLEELWMEYIGR